jgi:GntR family transcriptional regulator, transcriptional repressor for pyruvate dehydrogenase complex
MNQQRDYPNGLPGGVVHAIAAQITSGEFLPGVKLPSESALMARFSVSRTVVREAISKLQALGLVETYRGRGSYVLTRPANSPFTMPKPRESTTEDFVDLLDFRLSCEVEAASLAALRRTNVQLQEIARRRETFAEARDTPSRALDADFAFHLSIAAATNNHYYVDLLTSLGPTMIAMPRARLDLPDNAGRHDPEFGVYFEHSAIFQAIERRDSQGAHAAMRVHLASSRARFVDD